MARKQIPFVSGWRQPDVDGLIYEFCENMFPVSYEGAGNATLAMIPSPGNKRLYQISQSITAGHEVIRGMIVMNGYLWVVVDTYLIRLTPTFSGRTLTGFAETVYDGIVGGNTSVRMAYSNNFELGIVDGHYIYSYSNETDTLINVTDYVNTFSITESSVTYTKSLTIPYEAKDILFIDNRFVIPMDYQSTFFVSYDVPGVEGATDPYTTPTEQIGRRLTRVTTTSDASPAVVTTRWVFGSTGQADDLQGIAGNNGNFYLFGRDKTYTYTDAGLASLPFQRVLGQTYNYGATSTYTIDSAVMENGVDITAFLSRDRHGSLALVVVGAGGAQKISNKNVEGFWSGTVTNPYDAIGFFYSDGDDLYYQLTFPTDSLTFTYDFQMQEWHRKRWTDLGRHKANCFAHFNDSRFDDRLNIFGDFESKWLYTLSSSHYVYEDSLTTTYPARSQLDGSTFSVETTVDNTEDSTKTSYTYFTGLTIPKTCVSPIFQDPDDRSITVSTVEVEYICGEGRGDVNKAQYTEDEEPLVKLRVSRDRGRTYGEPIDGLLGTQGDYKKRVIYYGIGDSHDGFVFKLTSYSKEPINILKMVVDYQVGED